MPITSHGYTEKKVIWIAAFIGLAVSGYLAYVKLFHQPIYCTPGLGDCVTVNSSQWSVLWGIPLAVFGMLSYLAVLFLVFFGQKIAFLTRYSRLIVFGIGTFGFLYSLYLTYLELFVLKAICQWCLVSALCMTVIFIASILWIKRVPESLKVNRRKN
jgi:uncharacterized membrane protein